MFVNHGFASRLKGPPTTKVDKPLGFNVSPLIHDRPVGIKIAVEKIFEVVTSNTARNKTIN